jgi:small lipoprotein (TIGR04454 family)
MKTRIALICPFLLLAACSSSKPTTEECEFTISKVDRAIIDRLAPNQVDAGREKITGLHDHAVEMCADGKLYDQEDRKCILNASSADAVKACFSASRAKFESTRSN